jgi:hypothetical protein
MSAAEHLTYQGIDFGTGPDADKLRSTYMREGGETPERARIRKELADKKPHVDDAPGIQPTDSEPVTFLKAWPFYPTLTAIHIDPVTGAKVMLPGKKTNVETKAFPPDSDGFVDWVTVEKWIAPRNGKANLYFLVNPTNEPKDSKASATDIGALVALHVDVDVRVGEDQEAGIARIVKTFQDYKLWPCFIVASGGGAQAFWMLERPLMLDGTKAAADDAALYNVALERDLGGDHCHNVDRIMRLPGTLNIPNGVQT